MSKGNDFIKRNKQGISIANIVIRTRLTPAIIRANNLDMRLFTSLRSSHTAIQSMNYKDAYDLITASNTDLDLVMSFDSAEADSVPLS